jgi:hypothetical protein
MTSELAPAPASSVMTFRAGAAMRRTVTSPPVR